MKIEELDGRFGNIKKAHLESETTLEKLARLSETYANSGTFLVVNGSLARKEMVNGSDFDAFVVRDNASNESMQRLWKDAHIAVELKLPGSSGIFGEDSVVQHDEILLNIGGTGDSNESITRRMLLILESIGVGDVGAYHNLIKSMLIRYISEKITDHQLALFLLNDIIRYYRTVCVDFEFKTEEDGKPWGIRNIKLVFSRKLIYFSGLLICAETAQRSAGEKRAICERLVRMTPIERVLDVLGEDAFEPLMYYDKFLERMAKADIRKKLEDKNREKLRKSELFRSLKNDGHHFSMSLRSAFVRHYDGSHPIHRAIMF
ncbi:hypothetical protein [Mesorhizobium sp. B2-7-2]|uniref:hypothetical protein n=1 Tax=Mesorhizobium sp. B2-7-2 TaxID=2589908 RepID=UPI001128BAFF|nr:hypothetical protein [Mesorhizobium sp. B2-7-2]TPJ18153.1 hypothetical protein FJ425_28040 [Mesorhizobium sp. B2-7-2]